MPKAIRKSNDKSNTYWKNTHCWKKACDCRNATASNNRFVYEELVDEKTQAMMAKITFYPQPVCDICNKPWIYGGEVTK